MTPAHSAPVHLLRSPGRQPAARAYLLEGIKKEELDKALGYFENNAPRMHYHWFRKCGLFVGAGVVEAGGKAVIGQRLKQSGMHWTAAGAGAITTLRCQQARRPDPDRNPQPGHQPPDQPNPLNDLNHLQK
jgi:hypothetical protein